MALLDDFVDPYGGPRVARIPDWATDYLVADLDAAGFIIKNLDLTTVGFGPVPANYFFGGPLFAGPAIPTFRPIQLSEIGAQPYSDNLTQWAEINATALGESITTISTPGTTSFLIANHLDNPGWWSPSQAAAAIGPYLTEVADINFATNTPGAYTVNINGQVDIGGDFIIEANQFLITAPGLDVELQASGNCVSLLPTGVHILAIVDPDFGWASWTGTGSKAARDTATATVGQCAQAIKAIIDALKLHSIFAT